MEKDLKLSAKSNSPPIDDTTYRQLVGSLIYLSTTRPNISFAVAYISRFMTAPKADQWMEAKRVLRYVKGTSDYGLLHSQSSNPQLSGFTDSNWVGSVADKKSTSGYVFSLGSDVVTWTNKQKAFSLSSTEAEYRGIVKASCEVLWLRQILGDMQMSPARPATFFVDNEGIIKLARNLVFHEQTKNVDVHYHYIG